jgi:WD40 repeat protein
MGCNGRADPAEPLVLEAHQEAISAILFLRDGKTVVSASFDRTVKLWNAHTKKELASIKGYPRPVLAVAISPDGRVLASGSTDASLERGEIRLWDLQVSKVVATWPAHKRHITTVAFSKDGELLATGSDDGTVKVWDLSTRRELYSFAGHKGGVVSVGFIPGSSLLAAGSRDGMVRLWDTGRGELRKTIECEYSVSSMAVSPDGNTLAIGYLVDPRRDIGEIRLVGVGREEGRKETRRRTSVPWCVVFAPDGKTLAAGGYSGSGFGGEVCLWEVKECKLLKRNEGHNDGVQCVAFSPDGKELITGSLDGTIVLWNPSRLRDARAKDR